MIALRRLTTRVEEFAAGLVSALWLFVLIFGPEIAIFGAAVRSVGKSASWPGKTLSNWKIERERMAAFHPLRTFARTRKYSRCICPTSCLSD